MITLLPMPTRKGEDGQPDWQDDSVTMIDPEGAYLCAPKYMAPDVAIIVRGPLLGTPADYAAAVSREIGRPMRVVHCWALEPALQATPDKAQEIWEAGFWGIRFTPDVRRQHADQAATQDSPAQGASIHRLSEVS